MSQNRLIASLDIGSNSVMMLLAKQEAGGNIIPINEFVAVTRLSENIYKSNMFSDEGINRTLQAVLEMRDIAVKEGASDIIVTAGASIKKAVNRSKFLIKCHQALDIYPQVLSSKEEAKLSFLGASTGLQSYINAVLIMIGASSTHISYGVKDNMIGSCSFDIGCVMLNEKFDLSENVTSSKQRAAQSFINKELVKGGSELESWLLDSNPQVLLGGGTALAYASIINKQVVYDRKQIAATRGSQKDVANLLKTLSRMKIKDRTRLPGMEVDRAEIVPSGLLMLLTILKYYKLDNFWVTPTGLRTGVIRYYLS